MHLRNDLQFISVIRVIILIGWLLHPLYLPVLQKHLLELFLASDFFILLHLEESCWLQSQKLVFFALLYFLEVVRFELLLALSAFLRE